MSLFGFFRRRDRDAEIPFLGCWQVIRVDGKSQTSDTVELEFGRGGRFISSVKNGNVWEITHLDYRVEGAVVVFAKKNRTGFKFEADGTLRLDAYDSSAWYRRGPKEAPEA